VETHDHGYPTHIAFTPDGNWLLYHDVDAAGKMPCSAWRRLAAGRERIGPFPTAGKSNFIEAYTETGFTTARTRLSSTPIPLVLHAR
jgi:hypothetical protein